jgi:hypothetical protein
MTDRNLECCDLRAREVIEAVCRGLEIIVRTPPDFRLARALLKVADDFDEAGNSIGARWLRVFADCVPHNGR